MTNAATMTIPTTNVDCQNLVNMLYRREPAIIPPSGAQVRYMLELARDHLAPAFGDTPHSRQRGLLARLVEKHATRAEVSLMINWLRSRPFDRSRYDTKVAQQPLPKPAPKVELIPGVYEKDGEVYVIRKSKDGRLYAMQLMPLSSNSARLTEAGTKVNFDYVYAPGAMSVLNVSDRMSLERAQELTIQHRRCLVCGRRLKAADSVARGIGPVCAKMYA